MIITITLSPSLEYILKVKKININSCLNAHESMIMASGSGINVSRMLNIFNQPNAAFGFLGGNNGDRFRRIVEDEGIYSNFIPVKDETPINVEFEEYNTNNSIKVKANGIEISNDELKILFKRLENLPQEADFIYVGGDVPNNIHRDVYAYIIGIATGKGIKCILDAENEALIQGITGKPFLIKPNIRELSELVERENLLTMQQIIIAASQVIGTGIKNVVVSLGKEGAVWVTDEKVIRASAPAKLNKKIYGAGNAMTGGLIYAIHSGYSIEDSLKYGIASGTAMVINYPNFPDRNIIEDLRGKVKILSVEDNEYI